MQKLEERISRLDEILNVPNNFLKYEQLNLLSTIHKLEEIFTNFTQQTDCHDFQIKSFFFFIPPSSFLSIILYFRKNI